jgi:amidase
MAFIPILMVLVMTIATCGNPTITPAPTTAPTPELQPTEGAPAAETEEPVAEEEVAPELSAFAALRQQNLQVVMDAFAACPQRTFPLPDPETNTKRPLDLSMFDEAMAGFSPDQAQTMNASLAGKTIPEIQELLDSGELTSEQLVLYYLDRIQRYDVNRLNSVMELNPEALTIARALDEERASGANLGPLHGIPVLLKDNIATGDQMHTTAGNYALKDWQADRDAFLVQQLRDAGAIIMGKANLSEWANYTDPCMPSGFSALGGQVRHPYGHYDPKGSSTGSAVSVAANLTTVSVGSETAGSLVQPARTNSVVGMRPSQGLISRDYIVPLEAHLDTPGPMGRSVTDLAILLTAMAGADDNDPKTADATSLAGTDFTQFLSLEEAQKLKVGVVVFDTAFAQSLAALQEQGVELTDELGQALIDGVYAPQLGAATSAVQEALQSQGIEYVLINESELPQTLSNPEIALLDYGFQDAADRFFAGLDAPAPVSSLAAAVAVVNEDAANRAPYGQRYVEWSVDTSTTAEEYEAAVLRAQMLGSAWIEEVLQAYDVDVLMMGMIYANAGAAGVPALTIPAGQIVDPQTGEPGEPAGVILTGDYLSDAQLIAVGYALEQALQGRVEPSLDATIQQIESVIGQ